jgi:NTE family protein
VAIGDRRLVDGGVVNNTPISHAVALGAQRIYVLPAQPPGQPLDHPAKSALDAAIYGLGLLIGSRLESDIARYTRDVDLVVMPAPNSAVQPTSFEHSRALIREALAAARRLLSSRSGPPQLRLVNDAHEHDRPVEPERRRLTALRTAGGRGEVPPSGATNSQGGRAGRATVPSDQLAYLAPGS